VPSRRFGRSLGIDLTPYKTCSLDCIFCQLGRTRHKTVTPEEFVPTDAVLAEIKDWLRMNGKADVITLSGSGEPTLHSRFGEVLEFVRGNSNIPAILLTNGTMLTSPAVREAAAMADVVKVSLSAWNQASYEWVNRPHLQLTFDRLIEGQKAFRAQFKGQLWIEVFLVHGINSLPVNVKKIAALAKDIGPDRIQLNTAVRPPAEDFALPLSNDNMAALTHLFCPAAEIMADYHPDRASAEQANQVTIFSMLERRPCTMEQIADTFGMHLNEVSKYLGNLMRDGRIKAKQKNSAVYYAVVRMAQTGRHPNEALQLNVSDHGE
jgi:wyosine [tRNA(Phe)-imidazoG37] synthetase (radical SAM superfamily)